ncbi:Sin3 associated polypeptide p18-domain-containing protein [Radiomyces spectabilis]|uniref:Sin3 associated polypeptide p18-domain-containing protein n=1 Tax=Radiomyces spectabilis TaxID=64574 RepID=UPI00221F053B|nr:Sin3 associated polypeptide p18-domain-containing protein [Radiomyces spectabilis]KAI8372894.1 Sin3 associated polypeptide p18-domain-containing protein [Radiomyces spectabilis]
MAQTVPVNREKDCPFLLRVFTRLGGFHAARQFSLEGVPEEDELQLYTWKDATLEELAQLIREVIPDAQHPDARIVFRLIYLDSDRAMFRSRNLGRVTYIEPSADQSKTLDECNFVIGDYLDVAIHIGPPPPRTDRPRNDMRNDRGSRFGDNDRRDRRFGRDARPFYNRRDRF